MIILKILLWILLAVIGLIIVVCILPVGGEVSYIDGKVSYKVKLWLLNIMDSDGGGVLGWLKRRKKNAKPKKPKKPKPEKAKKKKKGKDDNYVPEVASPEDDNALNVISDDAGLTEQNDNTTLAEVSEDKTSDEVKDAAESKDKKKSKKKKSEETYYEFDDDDEDNENNNDQGSIGDKIGKLIDIWHSAKRPLRSILKGFKFSDVYIDFIIANEDAYKCALRYAKYSTIIYNALRIFSDLFTVRLKTVDIQPGFGIKKSRWDAATKLNFRLGTAVIAGVWFLVTYIFRIFIPNKLKARKAKKAAKVQE